MNDKGTGGPGARLRVEYDRLKTADPFQVLGVAPSADVPAIRWAFLELTKRYHPNRFARESAEVRDLANELFLTIRRAYAVLSDDQKRKTWRERIGSGKAGPSTQTNPIVVPPAPGAVPKIDTVRPVATPHSAPVVPPAPPASTTPPAFSAARRAPTPPAAPAMRAPVTPPPVAPAGPAVSFKSRNPTPPSGSPSQPQVRPATDVNAVLEQVRTRGQRFEEAYKLLAQGDYKTAREAFHKIAAEDPQTKKYRLYLYYAWGLEHRAAGRIDDAIKELERALALEPAHAEVAKDLDRTKEMKKGGGLFSKLFGR